MSYLYWTDHRRPAAYQAPEPSNNGSISNHFDRFARYGYNPSLEYRNQHTYLAQRRDRVAYDPAIHGQYAEAYYPQTSSTRPADSQNGRHMDRHGFDYQQYDSNQNDDSEGSSTAAVVGSRAPQSFLTPPSVYHHPHNTAQIGDPSTQAIHSQYQHEPLMNHSVPYDWTARTTSGGYRGPPYQYGGQTPMYPNTSLMPTSYHASQAWANRPQPTYVSPPGTQNPSFACIPPTYIQNVPGQPSNVNALYPAEYQRYPQQPPQKDQPSLSDTAIDQAQYPQVNNNETTVNPTPIAPGATRPPKKNHHHRGKGKGGAK